jgi:hypothetical protein
MVKSLKHMEKALRTFVRGKFAAKENVKYQAFGADDAAASRIHALKNANQPHGVDGEPTPRSAGAIYVQIGAGAGDQDSRADFRDGFTEYVKKLPPQTVGRIILVEPNPINIPALKRCWENYPQAEIYQYGVVPKRFSGARLNFYYLPSDAPHYQVASVNAGHVLKHYKRATIADLKVLPVDTIDLELFMELAVGGERVELLSLDIEGIDADVLLDTDLTRLNVNSVSFEHVHLGASKGLVVSHFEKAGFVKIGNGVDYNNYDWLYQRTAAGADWRGSTIEPNI